MLKSADGSLRFWGFGLGRRLVTWMILVSALLSVLAAAAQLWVSYKRDLGSVLSEFTIVEESFLSSLENALWEFNLPQIEVLLDGVLAQIDVVGLTLVSETGETWERGADMDGPQITRSFALTSDRGSVVELGVLTVTLSLERIRSRLLEQFWTLLASNFLKTMGASFAMLLIFEAMVGRHLRRIAGQAREGVLETGDRLRLDRPDQQDEIGMVALALNEAGHRVQVALDAESRRARQLEVANAQLRQANQEQAEFTYAISHDLKSPTNTIGMLIDELSNLDASDDYQREILADMARTNDRMRGLVDDVLDYSQTVETKELNDLVDLKALVGGVIDDLAADIASAEAEVSVGRLPSLRGNRAQLRSLFQNLISNAIKFRHPQRSPKVRVYSPEGRDDLVVVADNGIGIPEEFREKVFGLFQKLHVRREFPGTGLGLTVCRRIMSNHAGKIRIGSNGGIGTVIELDFSRGNERDQIGDAHR
ncbi:MAG: ATP-binding protein [Pseudomonadota bacterium]